VQKKFSHLEVSSPPFGGVGGGFTYILAPKTTPLLG